MPEISLIPLIPFAKQDTEGLRRRGVLAAQAKNGGGGSGKGNPYHDEKGRFTSADSAGSGSSSKPTMGGVRVDRQVDGSQSVRRPAELPREEPKAEAAAAVSPPPLVPGRSPVHLTSDNPITPRANDPATSSARWAVIASGETRSDAKAQADAMPPGKIYTGKGPMSDEDWKLHHQYVQRQLVLAGANDTYHSPNSTHIARDYVRGAYGAYDDARRAEQNRILNDYVEDSRNVPTERRCIMTGGPMGAGKSTLLRKGAAKPGSIAEKLGLKYDRYDPSTGDGIGAPNNFVVLSSDDITEMMADEDHRMIPKVDTLDPMETATFVHEEASYVSKQLGLEMTTMGKNVIWDFSMASPGSIMSRMKELRGEGYHVAAMFVDVGMAQSRQSAENRARRGHDQWLAGNGPGGRTPPLSHINASAVGTGRYKSKNRGVYESLKGEFDQTILVDNDNYAGKIVEESGRNANGKEPLPPSLTDAENRRLQVGDRVWHRDGGNIEGTVESVPAKGDKDDGVGVYWIAPAIKDDEGNLTGGGYAIREKHPAHHLLRVGGPVDTSIPNPTAGTGDVGFPIGRITGSPAPERRQVVLAR